MSGSVSGKDGASVTVFVTGKWRWESATLMIPNKPFRIKFHLLKSVVVHFCLDDNFFRVLYFIYKSF
jgi:hypothetical protein